MKIGFFTRCLCDGGTERVAANLSLLWGELGHEVVFLTQRPPTEHDFNHVCDSRIVPRAKYWTTDELLVICRRERFDAVVVNDGWNSPYYRSIVQVCHELNVRMVTLLHHSFNNWALAKCNEEDFDKDDILPLIDCLVCVDRIQALWWSRRHRNVVWIENPASVVNIKSQVESSDLNDCRGDCENKEIVWVGRPRDKGKRVELAIDAFKIIAAKDKTARLTVVGDIDSALIKKLLTRLNEDERKQVAFAGYVMDIRPYLEKATVNMVTTMWEVTVPQVIVEAQAAGIPTVALDLPVLRGINGVKCVSSFNEMAVAILGMNDAKAVKERKPFVDVVQRNESVKGSWEALFASLMDGGINKFVTINALEWRTLENAERLIDEIQRGETFYVRQEYPRLKHLDLFRIRANRILRFLGIRI